MATQTLDDLVVERLRRLSAESVAVLLGARVSDSVPEVRVSVDPLAFDDLDALIDAVLVDCYGDDEQLSGFRQVFEDVLAEQPARVGATVVGAPVEVLEVDYRGEPIQGLIARCRRRDDVGEQRRRVYSVAVADLTDWDAPRPARLAAAYRRWLGVEP